jgi:hypothetical protein
LAVVVLALVDLAARQASEWIQFFPRSHPKAAAAAVHIHCRAMADQAAAVRITLAQ